MRKFIYLFILPLLIISCSKSDDDTPSLAFLQKYSQTVWVSHDYQATIYGRIHNSVSAPFELWMLEDGCYYHENLVLGNCSIKENSELRFQCEAIDYESSTEIRILMTVQVTNEILVFETQYYEDGLLMETLYLHFQKSTVDVDKLPLCESNIHNHKTNGTTGFNGLGFLKNMTFLIPSVI